MLRFKILVQLLLLLFLKLRSKAVLKSFHPLRLLTHLSFFRKKKILLQYPGSWDLASEFAGPIRELFTAFRFCLLL